MIQPKFLNSGSVIEIVAPGSGVPSEVLKFAIQFTKDMGFKPRVQSGLQKPKLFFSNSDEFRFKNLSQALHSDADAIWCLRGGYGSNRLLPDLLKMGQPDKPKWLIGYSDITSLHVFLSQVWEWKSIHGPLLESMRPQRLSQKNRAEVFDLLEGVETEFKFKIKPMNTLAKKSQKISGELAGGNLMTLQSTLGTPFQFKGDNKIIFLEEIGERGYRIDRMLIHLQQSGVFKDSQAIIIGDFLGGAEPDGRSFVGAAIKNICSELKVPVFKSFDFGHGKINRPLVVGAKAVIASDNLRYKL